MLRFAGNCFRPVADNSCWCFPHNQQQAVPRTRPRVRMSAIDPKRFCFIERYRNTGRRFWPTWKQEAANFPPSCLTSSRRTFVVASSCTAFFASDVKTVGTAGSWRSRASDVDFAQAALVVGWPTPQPSVWIPFFPKCLPGNMSCRYPMPYASRWPIPPMPRVWCLAHLSEPSTPTSAAAPGSASYAVGCRPEA